MRAAKKSIEDKKDTVTIEKILMNVAINDCSTCFSDLYGKWFR
jgi:hypothetical protein